MGEDEAPLLLSPNDDDRGGIWKRMRAQFLAVAYCTVSIAAVFLNKVLLSPRGSFKGFNSVEFLMLVQALIGVILLLASRAAGLISYPIRMDKNRYLRIATVNMLFVIMTASNAYGVKHLSMPMVALLKNCQVVVVAVLERIFLKARQSNKLIASLCIIVFGSICGSLSDLEFDLIGYIAMGVAVTMSALYYVSIKIVFRDFDVPEFSLVFYNNLFSIPFFLLLCLLNGKMAQSISYCLSAPTQFWVYMIASGVTGAGVNITTYLFLSYSSPTTFSVLGVIKKIIQTMLGYFLWTTPSNLSNVVSVSLGVLGGIAYSHERHRER